MKMGIEEAALRFADEFFTDESKWERQLSSGGHGGRICVGRAIVRYLIRHRSYNLPVSPILGLGVEDSWSDWNDRICADFAELKARLKSRIAHYEQERLAQTHIAVIIIGPGRNVRRA